ncbi:DUF3089 domain-containing protein [Acetobacterium sp. K1/6]|jgi:hypothetical protein|uniref:DUF3089 domain-containing protein n=1 Tax=Acetobacterium sp. K1/6 TaxID=3055467 RepID=UPI000DBEBB5B|nr:DUF3089 domain-containing protein [Acetobacterium sp. K1/6]AWW27489.1 hypothetical protein DOZ58_13110 [Acetobacterium sp. KB-1]MDZ5726068.1 DUF3089 domain-containing protein [Acetobacterium sp. K1/6]
MKLLKKKMYIVLLSIPLVMLSLVGCGEKVSQNEMNQVDYAKESNWLALPEDANAHDVDVFYVYPTIYQGDGLQDISDPEQVEASQVPLRTQASVFADSANIYAPMYRQVGKDGFNNTENLDSFLQVAEEDVKDAFLYYLENYNNGKPFIIAGHSQGSSTLISLLTKIWGTTGAEDRMIATYIIGFSVTESDIEANPKIRMCENPTDIGCFISYNSLKDGLQSESVQILEGAIVTNPLSWESSREDGIVVPASENKGSVFFSEEGYSPTLYKNFTSAQIKDHGLVCEPADLSILSSYPIEGIYHPDDYSLFYENIKENIAVRINAYFN